MAKPIKWTDTFDIVYALEDAYPDCEILALRFTELHKMVRELPGFADDAEKSNEKILEAIQMTWLEERR
jgi:FeS assembly protein IscX